MQLCAHLFTSDLHTSLPFYHRTEQLSQNRDHLIRTLLSLDMHSDTRAIKHHTEQYNVNILPANGPLRSYQQFTRNSPGCGHAPYPARVNPFTSTTLTTFSLSLTLTIKLPEGSVLSAACQASTASAPA